MYPIGAAAAWVWVPPDAEDVETPQYRLVIHADRPASVALSRTRRSTSSGGTRLTSSLAF